MPYSQAGHRGFESRLVLHLFNYLETSEIHALLRLLLSSDRLETTAFPAAHPSPESRRVLLWSAASLSSIDAFRDRLALLRRSTWNVAHSRPTVFNLGSIPLFQTLSRRNGVSRSVGSKSACGSASVELPATARLRSTSPAIDPRHVCALAPAPFLGVSMFPL